MRGKREFRHACSLAQKSRCSELRDIAKMKKEGQGSNQSNTFME